MKLIKIPDELYDRLRGRRDALAFLSGKATFADVVAEGLAPDADAVVAAAQAQIDAYRRAAAAAVVELAKRLAVREVLETRAIDGELTAEAAWTQLPNMIRRSCISEATAASYAGEIDDATFNLNIEVANIAYIIGDALNDKGEDDAGRRKRWQVPVYDASGNEVGRRHIIGERTYDPDGNPVTEAAATAAAAA